MKKVGIIMGSDSDLPIVKKAVDMLKVLEIPLKSTSTPPTGRPPRPGISQSTPVPTALAF